MPIVCMYPLPPLNPGSLSCSQSSCGPTGTVSSLTQHKPTKGRRHSARTVYSRNLNSYSPQLQARRTPRVPVTYHSMVPALCHISEVGTHPRGYSGLQSLQIASHSIGHWLGRVGGRAWILCGSDGGVRCRARALHALEEISCVSCGCIACQLKSLWLVA